MELEFIKLELGEKLKQRTRLMSIEKKLEREKKIPRFIAIFDRSNWLCR
jgi:hypothetical protein